MQNQENRKNLFMERLKVEDEDKAFKLVRLIKAKAMSVEQLTKEQKQEVIAFLQEEVYRKKLKLHNLKKKILENKLKKDGKMKWKK